MIRAMPPVDPPAPEIRIPVEELVDGLTAPGALGALGPVEQVCQTHLSVVFLTPTHAIKCKKPARFWGLVDQASFARRERACHLEVELNRRLAPSLYLGVEPIVRRGTGLTVGGVGDVLEYAVLMRRLPAGATFAEQLRDGTLDGMRIEEAAARLARFHDEHALQPAPAGTATAFLDVLAGNFEGTPIEAGGLFPAALHVAIRNALLSGARRLMPTLEARAEAGRFVDGHGDVRLDHVAVLDEQIVVLDCVEFSETLRHIDRLSDAAFLDMGLRARGHPKFAEQFRRAYLEAAGESFESTEALSACFRAYRAYVRATVNVHTAADTAIPAAQRAEKSDGAQRYLALAATESGALPRPLLVLLRGTSGTGKSVLAGDLAPVLRAEILRSDVIRKELLGLGPTDRPAPCEQAAVYSKDMSRRTYAELRTRAERHLAAGRTVLLDATWLVAAARAEARALARRVGAAFVIIDLSCDAEEIERRLRARAARDDDASDAGVDVYREQVRTAEPLTEEERRHAIAHVSGRTNGRPLDGGALACARRGSGMTEFDPAQLLPPIERALRGLRGEILDAFHAPAGPAERKADGSAVTELDRRLERSLAEILLDLHPAYGVQGEESGVWREGSPSWHLDPLDGTANFTFRVGYFGSQLALVEGTTPLFAVVYEPLRDDLAWAARGHGCHLEGRSVQVTTAAPRDALAYADLPRRGRFARDPAALARIRESVYKLRSLGSIALQLRDVAAGVATGFVGVRGGRSSLHDLAPGALLIREAGGQVIDAEGGDPLVSRSSLIAGTEAFCAQVHAILMEPEAGVSPPPPSG